MIETWQRSRPIAVAPEPYFPRLPAFEPSLWKCGAGIVLSLLAAVLLLVLANVG